MYISLFSLRFGLAPAVHCNPGGFFARLRAPEGAYGSLERTEDADERAWRGAADGADHARAADDADAGLRRPVADRARHRGQPAPHEPGARAGRERVRVRG